MAKSNAVSTAATDSAVAWVTDSPPTAELLTPHAGTAAPGHSAGCAALAPSTKPERAGGLGGGGRAEIDTIVSDVGDVVIMFDRARSAEIERRHGVAEGDLLDAVLKSPAARLAAVGQLDQSEWLRRVSERVPLAAVQEWLAYHGELNVPVVEMLATARRNGLRVYLLSNATVRLGDDLDHHGVRDLADRVFCSADVGLAKPDPRVYEFVADATSLVPARTFYVDDTSSWVEAGRKLGMRGFVYGTPAGLQRELADLGVTA